MGDGDDVDGLTATQSQGVGRPLQAVEFVNDTYEGCSAKVILSIQPQRVLLCTEIPLAVNLIGPGTPMSATPTGEVTSFRVLMRS